MMNYQLHEQQVANGWDTPTKDLLGLAEKMNYDPSVMDILNRTFTNDVYDTLYPKAAKVINKMTNNRIKSRTPHDAMRDICLSFINKDYLAGLFAASNVSVKLYDKNTRTINKMSSHIPDFTMIKKSMLGTKTTRNVKFYFTNNPIKNTFLINTKKLTEYVKHDTILVIVNTNSKQFTTIHTSKLNIINLTTTIRYSQCLYIIPIIPQKVTTIENNINDLVKSIFK